MFVIVGLALSQKSEQAVGSSALRAELHYLLQIKEIIVVTLILIPSMTSINNEKLMLINEQLICFKCEIILTNPEPHKDQSQQTSQGLNFSPWKP